MLVSVVRVVPEQLTLLPASEQLKSVFEFDIVVPGTEYV